MKLSNDVKAVVGNLYVYGKCDETGKEINIGHNAAQVALKRARLRNKRLVYGGHFEGSKQVSECGKHKLGYWLMEVKETF